MIKMQSGETILDLLKRFTHLTNHLMELGKIFTNDDFNIKLLRSLTRAWQSKVTIIFENKILSKISSTTLFIKLQEHELELERPEKHGDQEK